MRIPKKNHELIRQNEQFVKKPQKHDANLQKNSTLYFQVGLIVVLLAVLGLFEMKFETTILPEIVIKTPNDALYVDVFHVNEQKPETKQIEAKKEKRKLPAEYKEVPDDTSFDEFKNEVLQTTQPENNSNNMGDLVLEEKPEEDNVIFSRVEQVPIYPGCENKRTNEDKRKCMSDKINRLVQKNFDGNIAPEYGLTGIQRINVEFKIDKTGHVSDIKTRAPHPKLQEEAERIVKKIPDMQPGMQRDKPVGVIYSLPIIFKVQN